MKLISFFILISSQPLFSQELKYDDGIWIEKPIYSTKSNHRYSVNNISFKPNSVFIYDYYYLDSSSTKKKFLANPSDGAPENPMNLTSFENKSDNVIDKIKINIIDELDIFNDSSYTQTVFNYDYLNSKDNVAMEGEITGIIDNQKNLWMHPPRFNTFKILQLSPYPFYSLDETNKSWGWNFDVGGFYLDQRWIKWKEIINIKHSYTRQKDETLKTPFGNLICKVTSASATSKFGKTSFKTLLKSYYHPKYGFVKLEYLNINNTKLVIDLIAVKEPANPITADIFKQRKVLSEYSQSDPNKYFTEKLQLKEDNVFEYEFEEKSRKENYSGKWKTVKDTLLLFDYIKAELLNDTLAGEELVVPSKDSIEIIFLDSKRKSIVRPSFKVNGKCFKYTPTEDLRFIFPKQNINCISVKTGNYFVKNKEANKITIYYKFNFEILKYSRLINMSKCLMVDKALIPIDCDGTLLNLNKFDRK